jgi:hypothetical protein
MGRKNKFESHIKPYLSKIPKWYETMTEGQIAKKLGVSVASWENYKNEHPELVKCLQVSKESLCEELKATLKKKAQGFYYTEKKKIIRDDGKDKLKIVEEYDKYALPDTGAIHLLLKNLDDDWRNDDRPTYELKKKQTEIMQQKADQAEW